MRPTPRRRPAAKRPARAAALIAAGLAVAPWAAGGEEAALEVPAPRLVNSETANMLPRGTWSLQAGTHQTDFNTGGGTGNQVYYGAVDWAAGSNLTLGFSTLVQEDANNKPIAGITAATRFLSAAFSAKYRFVDGEPLDVAALASVEAFSFRTAIFGTDVSEADHVIGSLHLPITYQAAPSLQLHLTPGVSVFPEDLNGIPYYGTIVSVGAGATWQPNPRLQLYGTVNVPVEGGNTIDTTRAITQVPVYTAGARYNFTPKVALEGYVTNGVGVTPATGIITFWPDGDEPLFGLKVHYTPNARFPSTYRAAAPEPTARDRQLQQDGFILSSAGVIEPGEVRLAAAGGDQDAWSGAAAFSPDRDFQIDAVVEQPADDGSVPAALNPTPGKSRWMAGGRIRVLDQNAGDPVSFSMRVLGGRDFENQSVGVLYVAAPLSYEFNDRLALTAQPAAGAFGNTEVFGLGLGANVEVADGVQLIGEVTPVSDGQDAVWAAGARYSSRDGRFSVDLSATNALGRNGYGTLVAQDSTRYSLGVSITTGLFRR